MAELQPLVGQINGGAEALVVPPTDKVGPKRQRRPSVRLGDIGDPQYDLHLNRRSKQWKMPMKDSGKPSKSRGAMNFAVAGNYQDEEDKDFQLDSKAAIRNWKARRGSTNRVTTSWMSKVEGDEKFSGGEDVDDGYRDFEFEGSESPLKDQSPVNSMDNNNAPGFDGDRGNYIGGRFRFSEAPSDTDGRNSERNGVREWLNQLGLGRYAPVFEIHEVDDEVLPMLTLEDLKDMGINAVGSRRKMYSSIQKLAKAFS